MKREVAGGLGFEPRQAESESAVLPLDDPPTEGVRLDYGAGAFKAVSGPVKPLGRQAFHPLFRRAPVSGKSLWQ